MLAENIQYDWRLWPIPALRPFSHYIMIINLVWGAFPLLSISDAMTLRIFFTKCMEMVYIISQGPPICEEQNRLHP